MSSRSPDRSVRLEQLRAGRAQPRRYRSKGALRKSAPAVRRTSQGEAPDDTVAFDKVENWKNSAMGHEGADLLGHPGRQV